MKNLDGAASYMLVVSARQLKGAAGLVAAAYISPNITNGRSFDCLDPKPLGYRFISVKLYSV